MQKTVLVTDDSVFMRSMLKNILVKAGYAVFEASDGKSCLDQYAEHKPDLVLLDITMPQMDGILCLKNLKQQFPESVVVMCSAMGQQVLIIEAVQNGAKDFIVKPFQSNRVIEAVNKYI